MTDGRKNNKGTVGNKGGRPPKAVEVQLASRMDAIISSDEVLKLLSEKVKSKDLNAIKLWVSYRFGMPKQSVEHSGFIAAPEKPLTPEEAKELKAELDAL